MKKLLWLAPIFILSCQSSPVIPGATELTAKSSLGSRESSDLKGKQISDGIGENTDSVFSPGGQLLLFVSRKRPEHPQAQVYELNLATGRERRLTFQNGDAFSPAFAANTPRFFYASNTDRLKEESYYLDNLKSIYSPKQLVKSTPTDFFDYYSSGLDGREIQKIGAPTLRAPTRERAAITVAPDGKHLAIAADGLWLTNMFGFEARKLTSESVSHVRFSADGKNLVWSQPTADGARLMSRPVTGAAAATVLLAAAGAHHLAPDWNPKNPNEIIFSSDRGSTPLKKPQFDLYVLEVEAKCLKRLTETPTIDETDPVFKPDGSAIAFTSTSGGSAQIYLSEYKSPAACLPLVP